MGSEGHALDAMLSVAGYNIGWLLQMIIKKGLGLCCDCYK
jgi:IS5 family transposase